MNHGSENSRTSTGIPGCRDYHFQSTSSQEEFSKPRETFTLH
jgi:hypothetical protein